MLVVKAESVLPLSLSPSLYLRAALSPFFAEAGVLTISPIQRTHGHKLYNSFIQLSHVLKSVQHHGQHRPVLVHVLLKQEALD